MCIKSKNVAHNAINIERTNIKNEQFEIQMFCVCVPLTISRRKIEIKTTTTKIGRKLKRNAIITKKTTDEMSKKK